MYTAAASPADWRAGASAYLVGGDGAGGGEVCVHSGAMQFNWRNTRARRSPDLQCLPCPAFPAVPNTAGHQSATPSLTFAALRVHRLALSSCAGWNGWTRQQLARLTGTTEQVHTRVERMDTAAASPADWNDRPGAYQGGTDVHGSS
ncbi:hypothetical protein PLESTM_001078500 [Pleodorina starrii]|nr:hypothetical protein PLESTM_001078500 [Pleodorina starrii]